MQFSCLYFASRTRTNSVLILVLIGQDYKPETKIMKFTQWKSLKLLGFTVCIIRAVVRNKMEEMLGSETLVEDISNKRTESAQIKANLVVEYDKTGVDVSNASDVITNLTPKKHDQHKILPVYQQHVSSGEPQVDSPEKKRLKLTASPVTNSPDPCSSPEVGKRRRIQHDYRRLSSAGYLDDYEARRERRFSSESDPSQSPSPSKQKSNNTTPTKPKTPELPTVPRVKLTLKLSKSEDKSYIHTSGEKGI